MPASNAPMLQDPSRCNGDFDWDVMIQCVAQEMCCSLTSKDDSGKVHCSAANQNPRSCSEFEHMGFPTPLDILDAFLGALVKKTILSRAPQLHELTRK